MKNLKHNIILALILILITSCSTSNSVVSNKFIQKRKYNKGFYLSKNKKLHVSKNRTKNSEKRLINLNEEADAKGKVNLIKGNSIKSLSFLNEEKRGVAKSAKNEKSYEDGVVIAKPSLVNIEVRKKGVLKKIDGFISHKVILKPNRTSDLDHFYYWNWTGIMIVFGVVLLITLLIIGLGWPAFLALLGKLFLYLLIAVIYIVIIIGLVVVSFGLVLLLGENFMSSLFEALVEGMLD